MMKRFLTILKQLNRIGKHHCPPRPRRYVFPQHRYDVVCRVVDLPVQSSLVELCEAHGEHQTIDEHAVGNRSLLITE